jgi:DNA repair exonuclease SbcCD ATPase subunit
MADKNYVIALTVDVSGAVSNLGEVEQQISETTEKTLSLKQQLVALQKEMQNLDPSDARFQELSEQAGALKDQMNDTADAIRNNAGSAFENLSNNAQTLSSRLLTLDFSGAGQSAKAMAANIKSIDPKQLTEDFNGLLGGFKEIGSSLKTLGGSVISNLKSSFKSLGTTLLANPIFLIAGAIIAIGVAIKAGLDQQREDVDNANKAVDNSNAQRHEQERKRIAAAGSDEKKLAEIKKQSIADDISDTEKKINNLVRQERTAYGISEEQEQELAKLREQLSKQRIDQEVLALDQINKLNSQRASIEERLLESGLSARERERRQIDLKYQKEIEGIKAVGGTQEDVNKILQLQQIEANNLSNKFAAEDAQKRKQAAEERKRQAAEQKAAQEQADKEELERRKKVGAEDIKNKSGGLVKANEELVGLAKNTTGLLLTEEQKRTANERKEQNKRKENAKAAALVAVQNASDALGAIMALNDAFSGNSEREREKSFKRNKAFSIAQALINTYQAVNQQLANPVDSLTGANFVKAGIALATGIANVAKIAKTKYEGGGQPPSTGGGGMGGVGGGNVGGSSAPTPSFNPIDFSILGQRPNQANQSFVLAGQVSNAQDANAKIKDLSRL